MRSSKQSRKRETKRKAYDNSSISATSQSIPYRYTDCIREDQLKRRLRRLLWGYDKLVDKLYAQHIATSSVLPRIPDAVVFCGAVRVHGSECLLGEFAEVWKGQEGGRSVALKVLRFYGNVESIRRAVGVSTKTVLYVNISG